MRKFLILTALIFAYLTYGVYLAQFDVRVISEELVPESPRGFFDYRGVTNVHTRMSSGSGDLASVVASAQRSGLDFISITDLNMFDKPQSMAGYHGHLLVGLDGEYSYLNSRLLNLGASTTSHLAGPGRSQVLFADMLSRPDRPNEFGSFFLAHPTKPRYEWTGAYPEGLDGMEVINLKRIWQRAWGKNKLSFFMSLLALPFNEKLALLRLFEEPVDEVRIWDEVSRHRKFVGIAGSDAEAKFYVGGTRFFFEFPSYDTLFSLVRNHIMPRAEFTGSVSSDLEKLATAVRGGQLYMSLDILGNPKGFNAVIRGSKKQIIPMGGEVRFREGLTLEVNLPETPKVPFDIIVYRNGETQLRSNEPNTRFTIRGPGTYRVMVRVIPTLPLPDGKKWIPWIYTNPFYVLDFGGAAGMRTTKPGTGSS